MSNKKEKHKITDEMLATINLTVKVDMSQLGIYADFMDQKRIKQLILSDLDEAIRLSDGLEPVAYNVKIIDTTYKSKPITFNNKNREDLED